MGLFGSSKKSEEGDLISKKGDYFDKEISESDKIDEITLKKLLKEGDDYFDSGKFDDALVCFDNLTKIDSEYAVGWQAKGSTLKKLDRIEEAKTCFDRALEIDPKNVNALKGKGILLYELGFVNEALTCFDKALEIDPKNAGTISSMGALLYKMGKISTEETHTYFDRALEIDPKNISHWRNKGAVFANTKKYNQSVTCFDRALEIDPEDVESLFGKGSTLCVLLNLDLGKFYLNKALEIDPNDNKKFRQKILHFLNSLNKLQTSFDKLNNALDGKFDGKSLQEIEEILDQINEEEGKSKYKISPLKLHYNCYEILGISKNATQKEIKTRFSELMLKFHPDKESSSLSKDMTLKIVEAYNILRDIEKRKQYDLKIR